MHNIDFDPITHRVSMPLETFLSVIRDAGKLPPSADEASSDEEPPAPPPICPNCRKPVTYPDDHRNDSSYGCRYWAYTYKP